MFGSSLLTVVCRRDHVLFMLFVFVCVNCCRTRSDCMNNMVGATCGTGTAYPSRASGFTLGFFVGSVMLIFFSCLCCVFCFVCLRPVFYAPNVARISGLSFLDCPLDFH